MPPSDICLRNQHKHRIPWLYKRRISPKVNLRAIGKLTISRQREKLFITRIILLYPPFTPLWQGVRRIFINDMFFIRNSLKPILKCNPSLYTLNVTSKVCPSFVFQRVNPFGSLIHTMAPFSRNHPIIINHGFSVPKLISVLSYRQTFCASVSIPVRTKKNTISLVMHNESGFFHNRHPFVVTTPTFKAPSGEIVSNVCRVARTDYNSYYNPPCFSK